MLRKVKALRLRKAKERAGEMTQQLKGHIALGAGPSPSPIINARRLRAT